MAKTTFKVEGLKELREALQELPKATGRNTVRRALTKAADPIESDAERAAPFLTGQLQRSMTIGTKLSRRQKSQHKKVSEVEIFVGPGSMPQAITQEFGTAHHRAQPFMRPAWDANKLNVLQTIKEILAAEIEKARARLARKAARLAAKTKA